MSTNELGAVMAAPPTQDPLDEYAPAKTPGQLPGNGIAAFNADPELLRWRAEILLDEMMLGAVDIAANGPTYANGSSSQAERTHISERWENAVEADYRSAEEPSPRFENVQNENGQNGTHSYSAPSDFETSQRRQEATETGVRPIASSVPTPKSEPSQPLAADAAATEPQRWLFSAEERYRQLTREVNAVPADSAQGNAAAPEPAWQEEALFNRTTSNGNQTAAPYGDGTTMTATSVRRVANQFAGSLPTNASNRRSTLLPRASSGDVQAIQQEIYTLLSEIDARLPASHESNQRAHRLLEKAQGILQSDPMRSAEVDYYLQQVRTIFQRVQQTIDWSTLYYNRLVIYLGAWIVLSCIALLTRYLYHGALEAVLVNWGMFTAGGLGEQHFATAVATFFGGALGGSLEALINLHRQNHLPHGFIDRKFGLRGLILPVIGALVGLVFYLLIAVIYYVLVINPAEALLFSTLPVVLAFLFGISQEVIYGTRE